MKIQYIDVHMTTQNPPKPQDDGDREQQDEDHNGSGYQS